MRLTVQQYINDIFQPQHQVLPMAGEAVPTAFPIFRTTFSGSCSVCVRM